jgi:hypothetical protein
MHKHRRIIFLILYLDLFFVLYLYGDSPPEPGGGPGGGTGPVGGGSPIGSGFLSLFLLGIFTGINKAFRSNRNISEI